MAGRKPLPLAIKQIKGTVQKCRTNPHEPRPTTALCTPPEYMSDAAKEAWQRFYFKGELPEALGTAPASHSNKRRMKSPRVG